MKKIFILILSLVCYNHVVAQTYTLEQLKDSALCHNIQIRNAQHDVEVVTHEAGHAFAAWMNRKRVPLATVWPGMEACEVHSMSMEFFAEAWAEDFFGNDTNKFLYSHLSGALTFIPYGTMVDHFQHIVYEQEHCSYGYVILK